MIAIEELSKLVKYTKKFTVLFVEDSEDIRLSVSEILEMLFGNVIIALDGVDGLEKFKNNHIDLVISDVSMPNMNGLDMARKIREIDEFIPFLFLSAFNEPDYILESLDIGVDGYLNKPLDIDKLVFYLKRILHNLDVRAQQLYKQKNINRIISENVIMAELDIDCNISYVTDAFCEISCYDRDELLSKNYKFLFNNDEQLEDMLETISKLEIWEGEVEALSKCDMHYHLQVKITPSYDHKHKHIGYVAIMKDIAMQKVIEKLNASLEEKVIEANEALAQTLKHTRESIEYAALIQSSLIPDNKLFRKYFKEYFVIWHPKDTVGGDIYLFNELRNDDECLVFCIDCTGHGVPGAFVTMLVKAVEAQLMAEIFNNPDMQISTSWVLSYFNKRLKKLLKQDGLNSISNVGFDGSVIYFNKKDMILKFSGAESPFFYRKPDGEIVTVKGTRKSVGYKQVPEDFEYKEEIIKVEEGTKVYLTTDGYLDQNGGEKGFPFGKKRFLKIIEDFGAESMADQQEMFMYEMDSYENMIENNERNDDVTVIGFTI